jgi:hypothetical protein
MKRVWMALLLLVSCFAATNIFADLNDDRGISAEVDRNPAVRTRGNVEVRSSDGCLTPSALNEFADLAAKGVADIAKFTSVPAPKHIVIYLSPRVSISHTYPHFPASPDHAPRLFIDSARVADQSAPYLHELVHAVAGNGGAMWLEEGFADWAASSVAAQYGGYYASVMSKTNDQVDEQARAVLARLGSGGEIAAWFSSRNGPDFASQHERRGFYIAAHSFTKFLAQSLGTRELVRIHRANDIRALARISGVSLAEWEQRWRHSLGVGVTSARLGERR